MLLHRCFRASKGIASYLRSHRLPNYASEYQRNFGFSKILLCPDKEKPTSDGTGTQANSDENAKEKEISTLLSTKYKVFSEEDATIILDVEEERQKMMNKTEYASGEKAEQDTWEEEFRDVDLTRGYNGVFDVDQLVELLESDGAIDVFVAHLPPELRYADHIVIVTGRSSRHRKALAQLVRRIFKKKHLKTEPIPRIEGDHVGGTNLDWLAMDLGNIILHIFARATREKYDLESLWSLGSQHDIQCNKKDDPLIELLSSHSVYIGDLEPAEPNLNSDGKQI